MTTNFDEIDAKILADRIAKRERITGPRIGDFVEMPSGEVHRFSHAWADGIQTSFSGSFYLNALGGSSFSGGLDPAQPYSKIKDTGRTRDGSFWFFHHDFQAAHNDVTVMAPCRIYRIIEDQQEFSDGTI